jgi:cysteine desulfuration protein SufE
MLDEWSRRAEDAALGCEFPDGAAGSGQDMNASLDEIVSNFELLDEWDDRYRYLIELGKGLEPLPEEAYDEVNKVRGCASQVWLLAQREGGPGAQTRLHFRGDSDAHIVRGLVALALAIYSGRSASEILATDAFSIYQQLGLAAHLTPQRSNGVRAMIERIKLDARAAAG